MNGAVEKQLEEMLVKAKGHCLFMHKWSQWSEPFAVMPGNFMAAMSVTPSLYQRRCCLRCNRIEQQQI